MKDRDKNREKVQPIDPNSPAGQRIRQMGDAGMAELENMEGRPDAPGPHFQNPNEYPPLGPMGGGGPTSFGEKDPNAGQPIRPDWTVNKGK